jgi:hypothetical protein
LPSYPRWRIWIDACSLAPGFSKNYFRQIVDKAHRHIHALQLSYGDRTVEIQKMALIHDLQKNDDLALMMAWFAIDGASYFPNAANEFRTWNMPSPTLEFDHKGVFRRVATNAYLYEGGESKASYKSGQHSVISLTRWLT